MSIQSEIDRIKANVAESYAAVSDMGGVLPDTQNSENLAEAVRGIPTGTAMAPDWSSQNLLDNWYFADPINQRGQAEYTGKGYTIDRWTERYVTGDGVKTLTESGIHLAAGYQWGIHLSRGVSR